MHEAMGAHGWADEETIFELRKASTDPNLMNYEGQTVWDIARHNPDREDWLTEALLCEVPEVPESAHESDFETQLEDTAVGRWWFG